MEVSYATNPSPSYPHIAVRRTASLRSPMLRASTSELAPKDVNGRDKAGHDAAKYLSSPKRRAHAVEIDAQTRKMKRAGFAFAQPTLQTLTPPYARFMPVSCL